jgi:hypothetical protein
LINFFYNNTCAGAIVVGADSDDPKQPFPYHGLKNLIGVGKFALNYLSISGEKRIVHFGGKTDRERLHRGNWGGGRGKQTNHDEKRKKMKGKKKNEIDGKYREEA